MNTIDHQKAIKEMGQEPMNPIGQCFESAGHQFVFGDNPDNTVILHGIGISNMPGEEGKEIAHAWLEFQSEHQGTLAIDTTWGIITQADHYRKSLQLKYMKSYNKKEFLQLWELHNIPGPFDEKILEVTKRNKSKLLGEL